MLINCLAVSSWKGGVGKSSIASNTAALAAHSGWRVCLVDLDSQGDSSKDLGLGERGDDGRELFEAVLAGRTPKPLADVRPGLDVLCGGEQTERLSDLLTLQELGGAGGRSYDLEGSLVPLAAEYDLVLFDCPVGPRLVHAALGLVRFVVVPTKADLASIDGLRGLARVVGQVAGNVNPDLEALGVVLFDVGTNHRSIHKQARERLETMLGPIAPVFSTTIRSSPKGAVDMRAAGMVAIEYEAAALTAKPWYAARGEEEARRYAANADGLAGDYQQLTDEILEAYVARRDRLPSADSALSGTADETGPHAVEGS